MISPYYLLVLNSHTLCPILEQIFLKRFKYNSEGRPFWISLVLCLQSLLVTSLQFSSWRLNDKVKNTPCAEEYGGHTMKADVTSCVKCLQQWTYTERHEACLMLTHISSQTFLSAFCLMTVSLRVNLWKGTLRYQIKLKHQI